MTDSGRTTHELHGAHALEPAPRPDRRASRLSWPVLAAAPVALALVVGGWLALREDRPADQPPPPAQPSRVASPAATRTPVLEAPGPGTVAAVRSYLLAQGFTCESEGQPGMDSHLCTHYTSNPAMMAYVGGATGHRLGRVALSVQDGPGGHNAKALALQDHLARQFVADPRQRAALLRTVRTGNEESYAETSAGVVNARGSSDGSVVLFVDGWVPDRADSVRLLPAEPLTTALAARGYRCQPGAEVHCTRSAGGLTHSLDYRGQDMEVSYLKLKTRASGGQPVVAPAAAEVRAVTGLFQQGPAIQKWLAAHRQGSAGATGFQDGMALDWYPGSDAGGAAAVFYVRESCWTDTVEPC